MCAEWVADSNVSVYCHEDIDEDREENRTTVAGI